MAQVAVGDGVAAAAGRTHGRHKVHIHQPPQRQLLPVVPAAMVHELAQQLDGRLRAVLLHLRHVQVVHEDDHVLALRRAVHATPPLVHLAVNDILLGGEVVSEAVGRASGTRIGVRRRRVKSGGRRLANRNKRQEWMEITERRRGGDRMGGEREGVSRERVRVGVG